MCEKQKFQCGYLILIKKLIFLKSCKNQIDFIKSNWFYKIKFLDKCFLFEKLDPEGKIRHLIEKIRPK